MHLCMHIYIYIYIIYICIHTYMHAYIYTDGLMSNENFSNCVAFMWPLDRISRLNIGMTQLFTPIL